jgi:peptide/nickel transport system substrate-binding protein
MWKGKLASIEKVIATDTYTVQFKLKTAGAAAILQIVSPDSPPLVPHEWVELGDLNNWKYAVGTGPWILTDYVSGTSVTFSANPNYWGYDERHPQNRLPYIDEQKLVVIADMATTVAALRTAKVDMIPSSSGAFTLQHVRSLAKNDPDIRVDWWPGAAYAVDFRCDNAPFTDINVRKALQISIDRATMAKTIYGGMVDGMPCGLISPYFSGWCFAYEDWPQDLKDEYSYNPTKAKQLLAEAGYPNGFKTNIIAPSTSNMEVLQAIKSYFMNVGVDMEIKVMDLAACLGYLAAGKQDQMTLSTWAGLPSSPPSSFTARTAASPKNNTHSNDLNIDEMVNQFYAAATLDEAKQVSVAIDRYCLEQHWSVVTFPQSDPIAWQPWVKGYSGEGWMYNTTAFLRARLWIDQDLRKSMGH